MDAVLDCDGLSKAWGGVRALDGVNLEVAPGEIVGLAGPNGAGKTTLLNAIAGQIRLDSGRITVEGRAIEKLSPVARRRLGIGRTFQAVRVFTRKSVFDNAALASEYGRRRLPPVRFRDATLTEARETLMFLGLDGTMTRLAGQLSVYQQKRLMLAMAMLPPPQLLLLDEPAGGLSPEEVEEMIGVLKAIRDRGTTVIVVDHVMSFLKEVVDRLVVLHEGQVLVAGLPGDVVADARVREIWLGANEGQPEGRDPAGP
jgi:branched-chain amino acid transport system ATP-binding protein